MQFREQGKRIQCIRSIYNPVTKKCDQKLICSFDRLVLEVPTVGLDDLTDAERQELAVWFDAQQLAKAERVNQHRIELGGQTLADLADAIRATGRLTVEQAAAVWHGLDDVAKALRKTGHTKPAKKAGKPAKIAKINADQLELL